MLGAAAAFRLRWIEARRRGGLWFTVGATALVAFVAWRGGETAGGRYSLARDLAALFAFGLAVFLGSFPLAIDRERRRAYLATASPATPVGWALGQVGAAAAAAGVAALLMHSAVALVVAATGGIATYETTRVGDSPRILWLPEPPRNVRIEVPPTAQKLRLRPVVYGRTTAEGIEGRASVRIGDRTLEVDHQRPLTAAIEAPFVMLGADAPAYAVGVPIDSIRALGEERSFLANALRASVGPAAAAAAVAAIGVAASAHLSASVAALAITMLALLGSLKPFLASATAAETSGVAAASAPPRDEVPGPARAIVAVALRVVPDLGRVQHRERVVAGEWIAARRVWRGPAWLLAVSGLVATALTALGIRRRRA